MKTYVAKTSEKSFTLIETVVALGLMIYLILEVAGVQGNAIVFSEYGRKLTQATWLARRILTQVEYNASFRSLKDMESNNVKEVPFEDAPEFAYSVEIKEWKLPIFDLLTGGGGKSDEEASGTSSTKEKGGMMEGAIKQVLGDDILKTAQVEVSWAEGASRNKVAVTLLLTNQQKVDEVIGGMRSFYDQIMQSSGGGGPPGPSPSPTPPAVQ